MRGMIKILKSGGGKFAVLVILGFIGFIFLIPVIKKENPEIKKNVQKDLKNVEEDTITISGNTEKFVVNRSSQDKKNKKEKITTVLEVSVPPVQPPDQNKHNENAREKRIEKYESFSRKIGNQRQKQSTILFSADEKEDEGTFISETYAPFGRLISCTLVNTIESNNTQTPLIGMVTEDLWWENSQGEKRLVIPAGTEVIGTANAGNPTRNRITSGNSFVLVFQPTTDKCGFELNLNGFVLEKSTHPGNKNLAAISDMTAGLPGRVIANEGLTKMAAYTMAALQGVAAGFKTSSVYSTSAGVVVSEDGTTQNAMATGMENFAKYALNDLTDMISKQSYFVRVPAGTEFYLFVTQVIDLEKAKIANTKFNKKPAPSHEDGSKISKFSASSILNKFRGESQ